uniref:Uncharacterized protein n=1 Tax=Craspedostauros australis TaxID=1486917 RepID=A0A7R9ZKA4_9STRA|mmetsp:Transcript_17212/g.47675  ORF Transcript_17212/g.47675 Transcript_17212/m.47675 type:complete len:331 (+) Transcript_17212:304-1296(+)
MMLGQLDSYLLALAILLVLAVASAQATGPAHQGGDDHTMHTSHGGLSPCRNTTKLCYEFQYIQQLELACDDVDGCGEQDIEAITDVENALSASIFSGVDAYVADHDIGTFDYETRTFSCFEDELDTAAFPDGQATERSLRGTTSTRNRVGGVEEGMTCVNVVGTVQLYPRNGLSPYVIAESVSDLKEIVVQSIPEVTVNYPSLQVPFYLFGNYIHVAFRLITGSARKTVSDGEPLLDALKYALSDFLREQVDSAPNGVSVATVHDEIHCCPVRRPKCKGALFGDFKAFTDSADVNLMDGLYQTVAIFGHDNGVSVDWDELPYDPDYLHLH